MEHSPTPWRTSRNGYYIEDSRGDVVMTCGPDASDQANGARIVACVNACAPLSDADLRLVAQGGYLMVVTPREAHRTKSRDLDAADREHEAATDPLATEGAAS